MKNLLTLVLAAFAIAAHAGSVGRILVDAPAPYGSAAIGGSGQTVAFNAQNVGSAQCGPHESDEAITQVIITASGVTGTATSIADNSYTTSIQLPDASGLPDGTILGGGSPASETWPQTGQAGGVTLGTGTAHVMTLDNALTLQRGTIYCTVTRKTGATDATNYVTLRTGVATAGVSFGLPYALSSDSAGTWTKQTYVPTHLGLRSATTTYGVPLISVTSQSFGGTTEKGFTFTVPTNFGTSNRLALCAIKFVSASTGLAAAGTYKAVMYSDPLGTPAILQETPTLDSDVVSSVSASGRSQVIRFPEDTFYEVVPGTKYGVALSHSGATSWSFATLNLPDADSRSAYPLGGLTYMTRTLTDYPPSGNDSAAFTETTTSIASFALEFCDFTAAAGGSGSMGGVY